MNHEKSIQDVYAQRNELVLALAKTLPGSGWGVDKQKEGWDDEWKTVVYLNTPGGQLSFHVGPTVGNRAREELPRYEGEWDGTWWVDHGHRLKSLVGNAGRLVCSTAKSRLLRALEDTIPDSANSVSAELEFFLRCDVSAIYQNHPYAESITVGRDELTLQQYNESARKGPFGHFRYTIKTRTF